MRKGHDNPSAHKSEFWERLEKLRQLNNQCATGDITFEQRVAMHNAIVPGIGSLAHSKDRSIGHTLPPSDPLSIREINAADISLDDIADYYED